MPVTQIRHINIFAPRELLLQLRDFYRDAVGLVEGERPPLRSSGFWLYAGNEPIVHLVFTPEGDERVTHVRTTLDHVAFGADDFEAMRTRLDALGITYRNQELPLTGERQLFFKDPAGNGVELLFPG